MKNETETKIVQLCDDFYRDKRKSLATCLMIIFILAGILILILFYQLANLPKPKHFPVTNDGRIVPLFHLSEEMLSPSELIQWAHHTAISAYTYNFVNYRDVMQKLQNNFTSDGWKSYEDTLKYTGLLEMAVNKKMVVSAVATGTPVILDQAVVDNKYSWKIQIPLTITCQNANEQSQQSIIITIIINRVPVTDMPKGVAIVSFVSQVVSS